LGVGGAKVIEALGGADTYHLNEGHALPAFFYLRDQGVPKAQFTFTTHTPEEAGNEVRDARHLNRCGFFGRTLDENELTKEMTDEGAVNYTLSALRMANKSNAVSKLHSKVANKMWKGFEGVPKIMPITNAQNQNFWQDEEIKNAWEKKDAKVYGKRKEVLKKELFEVVMNQRKKIFDPKVITIVWARRFAGYKRPDIMFIELERFEKLLSNSKYPVQIIWAGKPYPLDYYAINTFNHLVKYSLGFKNLAVLTGYELDLSRQLKYGSDVWLNTPRVTREASGTSGMTAAFNGSINLSTNDGWIPEFEKNGENSFVLPELDSKLPVWEEDEQDCANLFDMLENKVLPTYYDHPEKWQEMVWKGMDDTIPAFTSHRMATDYYKKLYS
jgi:starch phosphorylase